MSEQVGGLKKDERGILAFLRFRAVALRAMGYKPSDIGKGAITALADRLGVSRFAISKYPKRCTLARVADLLQIWEDNGGAPMVLRVHPRVEVECVGEPAEVSDG